MDLLHQIENHHHIQPEPHHADVVLLNTPVEDIDTGILRTDPERWLRVIGAANEIHERALLVAQTMNANVVVSAAAVDPRIIGGETAGQQGGRRAMSGMMRQTTEEGITVGPISARENRSVDVAKRMSPRLRTAILAI